MTGPGKLTSRKKRARKKNVLKGAPSAAKMTRQAASTMKRRRIDRIVDR